MIAAFRLASSCRSRLPLSRVLNTRSCAARPMTGPPHSTGIFKTRICKLFMQGACDRQSCNFAHGEHELRVAADAPAAGGASGPGGTKRAPSPPVVERPSGRPRTSQVGPPSGEDEAAVAALRAQRAANAELLNRAAALAAALDRRARSESALRDRITELESRSAAARDDAARVDAALRRIHKAHSRSSRAAEEAKRYDAKLQRLLLEAWDDEYFRLGAGGGTGGGGDGEQRVGDDRDREGDD